MIQPGLFDEPRTAPATAPKQVRAERIQSVVGQGAGQKAAPPEVGKINMGLAKGDPVTVAGRDYRLYRDCGEFVWLAALDAGIAGPFYWHRAEEIEGSRKGSRRSDAPDFAIASRAERIKAAQSKLAACELNGPEYMAVLGELRAAMRGASA